MLFFRPASLFSIIFVSIFLAGCSGTAGDVPNNANVAQNSVAANTNKANTNGEELGMLINFAWETEDLAWKKNDGEKSLIAAFRLSPEDAKKLSEQLTAKGQGTPKDVAVEEWFPQELIAQGESTGGSSVPATAFPADDLYQAPFTKGSIARVDGTDYFVIELSSQ